MFGSFIWLFSRLLLLLISSGRISETYRPQNTYIGHGRSVDVSGTAGTGATAKPTGQQAAKNSLPLVQRLIATGYNSPEVLLPSGQPQQEGQRKLSNSPQQGSQPQNPQQPAHRQLNAQSVSYLQGTGQQSNQQGTNSQYTARQQKFAAGAQQSEPKKATKSAPQNDDSKHLNEPKTGEVQLTSKNAKKEPEEELARDARQYFPYPTNLNPYPQHMSPYPQPMVPYPQPQYPYQYPPYGFAYGYPFGFPPHPGGYVGGPQPVPMPQSGSNAVMMPSYRPINPSTVPNSSHQTSNNEGKPTPEEDTGGLYSGNQEPAVNPSEGQPQQTKQEKNTVISGGWYQKPAPATPNPNSKPAKPTAWPNFNFKEKLTAWPQFNTDKLRRPSDSTYENKFVQPEIQPGDYQNNKGVQENQNKEHTQEPPRIPEYPHPEPLYQHKDFKIPSKVINRLDKKPDYPQPEQGNEHQSKALSKFGEGLLNQPAKQILQTPVNEQTSQPLQQLDLSNELKHDEGENPQVSVPESSILELGEHPKEPIADVSPQEQKPGAEAGTPGDQESRSSYGRPSAGFQGRPHGYGTLRRGQIKLNQINQQSTPLAQQQYVNQQPMGNVRQPQFQGNANKQNANLRYRASVPLRT